MKLLIEIDEKAYQATCHGSMLPPDVKNVVEAIKHGTPYDWAPASEPPKDMRDVLVTIENDENLLVAYYVDARGWVFYTDDYDEKPTVIAWHELPQPYKESEAKNEQSRNEI